MRYILAALLLIASASATPADARRRGHHHRHAREQGWYYTSGCHSYYCRGDSVRLRTHRYSHRNRAYSLGSRARYDAGYGY